MSVLNQILRRARAFFVISCAVVLAAGCGGGVGNGGTGITDDGGNGTVVKLPPSGPGFLQGPITGQGPLVVDGVRVEHLFGFVVDDDGNAVDPLDLQLGMTVALQGSPIVNGAIDVEDLLVVHTDLAGFVTAPYDPVTRRIGVLGQVVQLDANTVIGSVRGGPTGIGVGMFVTVYAQLDPVTGVYLATRIDGNNNVVSLATRGAIVDLDTAAASFRIGTQVFDYAGVALPPLFGSGQIVRVRFGTTQTAAGHWVVTGFQDGATLAPDGYVGYLRGDVGQVLLEPAFFYVAGLPVDARTANFSPVGGAIVPGMRVQVFGAIADGIVVADRVQVLATGDGDLARASGVFTINGVSDGGIRKGATTFTIQGSLPIGFTHASFVGGTVDDLGSYAGVLEIRGPLSADGTELDAAQIKFDSPPTGDTGGKGGR